jgi:hypothetical protein
MVCNKIVLGAFCAGVEPESIEKDMAVNNKFGADALYICILKNPSCLWIKPLLR